MYARCSCICSSAERCQAAISVRRSSTSSRVIIRRPVHHVVPTTVRMTAVAVIQVCRFCRSMPCACLFSLLRETAPSPTASGGSGRRPALGLRGRRGRPGPGGRQARRAVAGRTRRPPLDRRNSPARPRPIHAVSAAPSAHRQALQRWRPFGAPAGTRPRRHHPGRPVPAAGCSGRRTSERRGRTRSRGDFGDHRRCPNPAELTAPGSVWSPNARWARIRTHWNALGRAQSVSTDGGYSPW